MPTERKPWQERLWEKVELPSNPMDCWLWQGALTDGWYGKPVMMLMTGVTVKPQRLLYQRFFPLDAHEWLHSGCGQNRCINPLHQIIGPVGSSRGQGYYTITQPLPPEEADRRRPLVHALWRNGTPVRMIAVMTYMTPYNVLRLLQEATGDLGGIDPTGAIPDQEAGRGHPTGAIPDGNQSGGED